MRYHYELIELTAGRWMTRFPDVPEALGQADSRQEAIDWAEDCLLTALAFHLDAREPIPAPTMVADLPYVEVPSLAAMKITLHNAMLEQGVTQVALAKLLHTDPKSVRRLLDLDHASRFDHLEAALAALGYGVSLDVHRLSPPASARQPAAVRL